MQREIYVFTELIYQYLLNWLIVNLLTYLSNARIQYAKIKNDKIIYCLRQSASFYDSSQILYLLLLFFTT